MTSWNLGVFFHIKCVGLIYPSSLTAGPRSPRRSHDVSLCAAVRTGTRIREGEAEHEGASEN